MLPIWSHLSQSPFLLPLENHKREGKARQGIYGRVPNNASGEHNVLEEKARWSSGIGTEWREQKREFRATEITSVKPLSRSRVISSSCGCRSHACIRSLTGRGSVAVQHIAFSCKSLR